MTRQLGGAAGGGRSTNAQALSTAGSVDLDPYGRVAPPAGWSTADLHCHTDCSDGIVSPGELLEIAKSRGVRVVAITDHDMVHGALRARSHGAGRGTRVVVGQEVTTRWQHHIVGLFLNSPVPIFRTVPDTVRAIRDQGGLAVIAHPALGLPSSASIRVITEWLEETTFDGIELDSQYISPQTRDRLLDFYDAHRERLGAAIGGTDAHFGDVGKVVTLFEGETPEDLRIAIESRRTAVARTGLEYPKPGWRMHLKNQRRSLLWLPLYRLKVLLTGNYSKSRD